MAGRPTKRAGKTAKVAKRSKKARKRARSQKAPKRPAKRGSDSRARPEERKLSATPPATVRARVAEIAEWMRQLWWDRGRSVSLFSATWGIPESTIRNYSTEAHRIVMAEVDAETCGRETGLALRKVLHDATKDNDRHSVIRASEVWATLSGSKAAEKYQEIPPEQATPAKARQIMRELAGEVTPDDDDAEDPPEPEGAQDAEVAPEGTAGA